MLEIFNDHNYFIMLHYTLDNPYSNIVDRGNSVVLTSALKVDPDGNDYVLPKESDIANKFNRLKEKDKFSSLVNGDYKYWRFIGDPIQFNPVTVTQSGLTKEVANTIDNAMVARQMHLSATSTATDWHTHLPTIRELIARILRCAR